MTEKISIFLSESKQVLVVISGFMFWLLLTQTTVLSTHLMTKRYSKVLKIVYKKSLVYLDTPCGRDIVLHTYGYNF